MDKKVVDLEKQLLGKIKSTQKEIQSNYEQYAEGLQMHAVEMENEARKTRLLTESRFKAKSQQYEQSIIDFEEMVQQKLA